MAKRALIRSSQSFYRGIDRPQQRILMRRKTEGQMTRANNPNAQPSEATLQDAVDAIEKVDSTISQLGVEVQRILVVLEGIAKSLEQIADAANNR